MWKLGIFLGVGMRNFLLFVSIIAIAFASQGSAYSQVDTFSCDDVTEISNSECLALVAIYNASGGANWVNNTDWLDANSPFSWFGVTISSGAVTGLDLRNNGLIGALPPELGMLINLEDLYLSSNKLSGPIPLTIGNLSKLMHLFLDNNQLTGSLPTTLGNLSNLWYLDLSWNQLSGQIPSSLGNLKVWQFDLSANQLSGSIPAELGLLVNVVELQLQGNQLTGSIPPELGNLLYLQRLNLSYNQINGSIPSDLGKLTYLRGLYLYNNQLSGTIPAEMGNLTNLEYLILSSNQLTGPLPTELDKLTKIVHLELSWNPLNTSFPIMLTNLTNLRSLSMGYCKLYGPIPEEISNLSYLEGLDLQSNQLLGDIPPKFVNLVNLSYLNLGYNHLNVPANPQSLADFLTVKDPDWYKTQAFDQIVEGGTDATVEALDGSTVIHIFSASLATDVTFTFVPQPEPNQETGYLTFAGNSFLLNALNSLGESLTVFNEPLTVEIYYDESTLGMTPEKKLALYYWNLDESKWLDVVTTCENGKYIRDLENDMFSVQLCHLSEFSLMGVPDITVFLPLITH